MNEKFYLKIGNLNFTKRAILILSFGFFLTGIILGGLIISSIKSTESFNLMYYMFANIFIWFFTFRSLKNEVVEKSNLK
jgi:hypothetical protein